MSDEFTLTDEQIQQALGPVSGRSARPELSLVQPDPEPEPTPAPEPLDLSWRPDDPNERRDIPPAFDWDAAAQQMKADDERAIRGRLNLAKKDNPDTQAKVQRLSSATGLPPDLVARDPEDVQRRHEVASIDLDQLRRDAPITYSRLTDPQFLGVAHDDIQTMGSLERWIKGSALSAVGGATVGVGSAALDASAFVARGLSAVTPEIAGVDFFGRAAADLSARAGAADEALKWLIPDAESSTESAFQSGFQSFGQNMALMPLGVAQASAQAAGAAIAYAFGAVTGSKAYGEATRAGKGDLTAGIHGVTQAAIEAGTELIPAIKFFEMLGSRTGVVEMLAKQAGWEGATEQIATLLQDMGEWLVMNQDGTLKEFLEARPEAAYQTLIATLVGTVAQVGTMKGIMAVTDKASGKAQSQQKAQDGANALQRAFDIVAKSKTQERSPETIAEFVADVAPDQSLYVDAQVLNQSARKMPPEEFTRLFPKTAEQMAEALVTHSDVEMPLSEVLAAAGTDLESVLVENARLDDNPETLSLADAKAEVKIAEEMIKADAERVMQQAADQDAWVTSADMVMQTILADLESTGRNTPDANIAYATLTRDIYSAMASRLGMPPDELYARYPLQTQGQNAPAPQPKAKALEVVERQPASIPDERLQDSVFRYQLERLVKNDIYSMADGNLALATIQDPVNPNVTKQIRTKSINPEWWQSFVLGEPVSVEYARKTIAKLLAGKPLRAKERRVSEFLIETLQGLLDNDPFQQAMKAGDASLVLSPEDIAEFADDPATETGKVLGALAVEGYSVGMVAEDFDAAYAETEDDFSYAKRIREEIERRKASDAAGGSVADRGQASESPRVQINPDYIPGFDQTLRQGDGESLATFNPEQLLITLKEGSNLSSYLHELGHFYLEVLADVASQPDAPQQIVDDMNTLLAWFGVPDLATWNGYTLAEKATYHEKYAESFEQYLFEGKAPSIELQPIFRRFRAWMIAVYKNLSQFFSRNPNASLTDEIRQVMDRMVATDEAIAAAEKAAGMDSDFEATNTAIEALQKRSLANMKWLTNAKSRFIKALQKQAESLRKGVREEISAKLQKEPVYRAIAYIRKGSITGPGGTQIKLEKGTTRKLSRAAVEQMFDADSPLPWRAALEGMLAESGADPDFIAQEVGFSSGAEMVDALIHVEPLKDAIERETDRVMLERHGELTTPELVEQAANEAVHNKARARALAAELTSQQEALSARETAGTTPRGKTVTVNAVMAAAKRFAADLVARKKIRDLKRAAQLHRSAEAKASKAWAKATAAGKTAEAIQAKRDQALNNAAARAMLEAVAETEKALEYLKKFDRATIRKNIPIDYLEQIDNLLERVDLRKSVSGKALDRRESLRQWYTAQEEMGLTPVIPQYLLDDAQLTSYKDMTVEELRGLVDSVKNIEHLGKLKHKLLTLNDKREFDALVDEMVASIEANGGKVKVIPPEGRGPADKWMNGLLATHRKFASVLRQMDGLNDDGIFWQTLVRAMNDRATDEQVRLAAATEHLGKLIQPLIDMPGGLEGGKRLVRALKAPMSRAGRIAVMLNTGNTQNRQRMEDGNGITAAAIEEIAAQMTPAELEFVNQAWEFVDSFWPEVKAKQERVTGLSEDKVEAEPFEAIANDGTRVQMRGGYYPIKYDPDQSVVAHKQEATQTALEMFRGAITRATTRRGHTEARVKEVKGRPVRLNLEVLSSHTAEVIHDLVWHEWLIDANRVLSNPRVSEAIRKHYGPDTLRTLKDDLVGVAGGDIVAMDSIHKALMRLRANISRAVMGISMTTGLLQPFGILQSVVRVGWGPVLRGLGRWAGDAAQLESSMTWIREKSPFMKLRAQTFNRELYEINKRIKGKAKITEIVDAGLFMMMQKMQMVADIPTWIGTYQNVLEETQDEALAIAQADRAVKESQGSGQTVDLSAVQRDHPFLTQFYSYFNTTLNLAAEITSQTDFKNPKAVAGWVSDMALLMVAPAIIPSLLISLFRGEGDDDDAADWALKLAGWQVSYLAGLFVGVREFSGIIQGFDYSGPPVGRILNDIGRMGKQIGQGEVDEAAVIAAANVLGSGLGLPTVQLLRFYKGWKAWEEGEAPPTAVLFGPPHK